jgi:hypothetical protein
LVYGFWEDEGIADGADFVIKFSSETVKVEEEAELRLNQRLGSIWTGT